MAHETGSPQVVLSTDTEEIKYPSPHHDATDSSCGNELENIQQECQLI